MRLSKTQISLSIHTVLLEPLLCAMGRRYRHTRTDFMRIPNTDRTDRMPLVTVFAGSTRNHTYVRYVTLCLVYCVKFSAGLLLLLRVFTNAAYIFCSTNKPPWRNRLCGSLGILE